MRAARELRDQLAEIERGLAAATRPGLALLRLTGPDRVETLHRVVSQDVKTLQAGQGKLALLLAAKGQFRALMEVFAAPGELWLLAPVGHGDSLADSLRRYLAFSKSALEPAAPVRAPILLLGPRWTEVAAAAGAPVEALASGGMAVTDQAGESVRWFGQTLGGVPGALAFAPSDAAADSLELLARSLGATEVGGGRHRACPYPSRFSRLGSGADGDRAAAGGGHRGAHDLVLKRVLRRAGDDRADADPRPPQPPARRGPAAGRRGHAPGVARSP